MRPNALTAPNAVPRLAVPTATSGLWAAMAARFRSHEPMPTVEVAELSPRPSMFEYDPAEAAPLHEFPDELL